MSNKDWTKELSALKSDDFTFTVPYHATLGEAADIAVYVRQNHKADKKSGGDLPLAIADEIDRSSRTSGWRTRAPQGVSPKADTTTLDRARFIIDEIDAVLEYFLDDDNVQRGS